MGLLQRPPRTPEEIEASRPLAIPPEEVARMDEKEWYERAFRGDAAQLTVRSIAMGTVLGFFLAFTNVYVGLKAGWALGVALTACIVSFTAWTTLLKLGLARSPMTILETNCMQSVAASAGYGTAVITSTAVPAMLMLTTTDADPRGHNLPFYVVAPWVFLVAVLGVSMAVPMKRSLVNRERLPFPEGTAAAVLLQSLYTEAAEALAKGRALLVAALVGVSVPLLKDLHVRHGHGLLPGQSRVFDFLPERVVRVLDEHTHAFVDRTTRASDWGMVLDHGVVLVGAGAIVGLRATVGMVAGAMIVAYGLGPMALAAGWTNPSGVLVAAAKLPSSAWRDIGVWLGAPILVAYGLVTFALQFRGFGRSFRSLGAGARANDDPRVSAVEVPMRWFVLGTTVAGAAIVVVAHVAFGIPVHYGALAIFLCFFLALVMARATGETGLTPGGPMGKVMQLTYGVLLPQSAVANLMTASMTAGSGLACADLLLDLKSGYLLGAHPRRQFVAQFLGIFTGTAATCIGYYALVPDATVLAGTPDHPAAFPAPAAQQWRVVADLFRLGIDNLHPMARWAMAVGLLVGTVLAVLEWALPRQRRWIPSATGIGLGVLLPFHIPVSFFLGALAAWVFQRTSPRQGGRFVVPIASGLIAGESIVGVLVQLLNNRLLR
jgi:uncharacterized oligopeptide transporter (OPT) family protein